MLSVFVACRWMAFLLSFRETNVDRRCLPHSSRVVAFLSKRQRELNHQPEARILFADRRRNKITLKRSQVTRYRSLFDVAVVVENYRPFSLVEHEQEEG